MKIACEFVSDCLSEVLESLQKHADTRTKHKKIFQGYYSKTVQKSQAGQAYTFSQTSFSNRRHNETLHKLVGLISWL